MIHRWKVCATTATILAALSGCGGDVHREPRAQAEARFYSLLPDGGKTGVLVTCIPVEQRRDPGDALNAWIAANPGKNIDALAPVLAYREGVSFFIATVSPGDKTQRAFLAPAAYREGGTAPDVRPIERAAGSGRMAAFAPIPAYGGGVSGYAVVLNLPGGKP